MVWGLIVYALIVLALLVAELRDDARAQRFFKPMAALGFVLLAIHVGALESFYGQIILAGLVACALGDVLLLSRNSEKLFMAGMVGFAAGHIAYITAMMRISKNPEYIIFIGAFPVLFGSLFIWWIEKYLDKSMRVAVMVYGLIIIIMVVRSLGITHTGAFIYLPFAAIMFAISDMFVARDRFVTRDPKNALAITPLYFGAQALFALSTQI